MHTKGRSSPPGGAAQQPGRPPPRRRTRRGGDGSSQTSRRVVRRSRRGGRDATGHLEAHRMVRVAVTPQIGCGRAVRGGRASVSHQSVSTMRSPSPRQAGQVQGTRPSPFRSSKIRRCPQQVGQGVQTAGGRSTWMAVLIVPILRRRESRGRRSCPSGDATSGTGLPVPASGSSRDRAQTCRWGTRQTWGSSPRRSNGR